MHLLLFAIFIAVITSVLLKAVQARGIYLPEFTATERGDKRNKNHNHALVGSAVVVK